MYGSVGVAEEIVRMKQLKCFFTEPAHGNGDMAAFRHPATYFALAGSEQPSVLVEGFVGMLDTGADLCRIDSRFVEQFSLAQNGMMPTILAGKRTVVPMYKTVLHFPEINFTFSGSFPVGPFKECESPYDAIFGMDLLKHFELKMIASERIVHLGFLGAQVGA